MIYFCKPAKDLDKKLAVLDATQIVPTGYGDDQVTKKVSKHNYYQYIRTLMVLRLDSKYGICAYGIHLLESSKLYVHIIAIAQSRSYRACTCLHARTPSSDAHNSYIFRTLFQHTNFALTEFNHVTCGSSKTRHGNIWIS